MYVYDVAVMNFNVSLMSYNSWVDKEKFPWDKAAIAHPLFTAL